MQYLIEEASEAISKRMLEYEQVLRGAVGLFDAIPAGVSRDSWKKYVENLRIATYWPGIQGIGFSLMIAPDKKDAHIQAIRAEGFPAYTIHPAGDREEYSAIIYLEPFRDRNLRAFGYDMYSEPVRRTAMEQAWKSGNSSVSGKVKLVQETATDVQAGFLMYIPVYQPHMPVTTVAERRAALLGFVYSPFRTRDLMRGILGHGVPDMDFELFDESGTEAEKLLYSSRNLSESLAASVPLPHAITRTIKLPGRVWTARFYQRPKFQEEMESRQPLLLLISGGVISLLIFALFRSQAGRQEHILREAQRIGTELHAAEARYQQMVENVKELIFQTDSAGSWSFLNPAWEEISGYPVPESLGRNFLDYLHPNERDRIKEKFQALIDGKINFYRSEACGVHRDGKEVWVEFYTTAQRDEQGMVTGTFGTLRDISVRWQAEQATRQAREIAESANRAKSEFLANMSHELRTPLNSLLILAKLLAAEENLTPEQAESARVIHDSGLDLLRLINDILDLSKVEAGRMEVLGEMQEFPLLLDALQRQFRAVALSRSVDLRLELAPDLPTGMITDWVKVEQILRNLLANAFKFTPQGTVTVRIHRPVPAAVNGRVDMGQEELVAFTVSDTGIGIPEEKQELIFETFQQVDGATSRKYGGTGLGLSIARRFAQLLGGEMQVASRMGEGSSFTLLLPQIFPFPDKVQDNTVDTKETDTRTAQEGFFNPRIAVLVVDDDERNRFAIGKILENRVGRVLNAAEGTEALQILEQHDDIHLVLMDIMMPGMDGYQAIAEIRRQPRFVNLPIIALTAKVMAGDRQRCLEAGANDYLPKPVQLEMLFRTMNELLSSAFVALRPAEKKAVAIAVRDNSPSPALSSPLSFQGNPLQVLLVDDDVRGSFSLAKVLQARFGKVFIATDGARALQLLREHPDIGLVLMDIIMPTLDGYDTMHAIRHDLGRISLPIIALTAKAMPGDEAECLEAGANAYLAKPVDMEQFWNKLEQLLKMDGVV
ncbi:MAG: CHASE domain-containing protein [Magnetococcus sp. XQGC-1]